MTRTLLAMDTSDTATVLVMLRTAGRPNGPRRPPCSTFRPLPRRCLCMGRAVATERTSLCPPLHLHP